LREAINLNSVFYSDRDGTKASGPDREGTIVLITSFNAFATHQLATVVVVVFSRFLG